MNYAVVCTGGKQVRLVPGEAVRVEKLEGQVGDNVEFSEVLLVSDGEQTSIGTPFVEGAKVVGVITAQGRGPKITTFKKKRRKNYRRKLGHRQGYTEIRVEHIGA